MSTTDVISLISLFASIASLVLAVVAIWLSVVFYRMSSELSERTTEAANGMGASVERLEKLFDRLYADTFSMMRDTVSDMRKHIWPESPAATDNLAGEAEQKADEKVSELKKEIEAEMSQVLTSQKLADEKLNTVRQEMRELIDRAIAGSRRAEVEAREETVRDAILNLASRSRTRRIPVTASEIIDKLSDKSFPTMTVVQELRRMQIEGLLEFSTSELGPGTEIREVRRKSSKS